MRRLPLPVDDQANQFLAKFLTIFFIFSSFPVLIKNFVISRRASMMLSVHHLSGVTVSVLPPAVPFKIVLTRRTDSFFFTGATVSA